MPEHSNGIISAAQHILRSDYMPGAYDGVSHEEFVRAETQALQIQTTLRESLPPLIRSAHPEFSLLADPAEKTAAEMRYVILKAVIYSGLLAAGQIKNTEAVSDTVHAISMMYLSDQAIDDGDEHMLVAVEQLYASRLARPDDPPYTERHKSLAARIPLFLSNAVLLDDLPRVQTCYEDQVLRREARHRRLSNERLGIEGDSQAIQAFWEKMGDTVARTITVMAGFPSVSHSLHAAHRRDNPELGLPPLRTIDLEPEMTRLLRISNVIVRLLDDLGDSQTDWGVDRERGLFSLNWLNQAREAGPYLLDPLMRLGEIPVSDQSELADALMTFSDPREQSGTADSTAYIRAFTLKHAQNLMADVSPVNQKRYRQYIQYAKRVHIIGQDNAAGDAALAEKATD